MARGRVVVALSIVLGVVAVALSFVAYSKRIKASEITISLGHCEYPSSPAFAIGLIAAFVLLFEQIVISIGTGCICCSGSPCPSSCCPGITAVVLFVISWLTFFVAFTGLIFTAIVNNSSYLANNYPGRTIGNIEQFCYYGRENLFLGAAFWSIVTIVLGILSYILKHQNDNNANNNYPRSAHFANEEGVTLGQPQMHSNAQQYHHH